MWFFVYETHTQRRKWMYTRDESVVMFITGRGREGWNSTTYGHMNTRGFSKQCDPQTPTSTRHRTNTNRRQPPTQTPDDYDDDDVDSNSESFINKQQKNNNTRTQ